MDLVADNFLPTMAEKITEHWEMYSHAEFTLRKSILKEIIDSYQAQNMDLFLQVQIVTLFTHNTFVKQIRSFSY